MNSDVGVWLWTSTASDAGAAVQSLRWAEEAFARVEAELSRFRPASGLSRLNAAAGEGPQLVSPLLWTLLSLALEAAEASGGVFDPTLLRTMERLGYDRSFEALVPEPESEPLSPRSGTDAWRRVRLDANVRSVSLPADHGVDLGGIAKGWTVDHVARALAAFGPVLVDAGGDLCVTGTIAGEPWPIAVQDAFAPERDRGVVQVTSGALATSSVGGRRWERGGRTYHHLVDPRTGLPASGDLHTVTVAAPCAMTADVAAKVALVLGRAAGAAYLHSHGLQGLLTSADGRETVVGDLFLLLDKADHHDDCHRDGIH